MINTQIFKHQLIHLMRVSFLLFFTFSTLFAQSIAIKGGRIITITGPVIEKGTIIIDGGIIKDVGLNINIPHDAKIIKCKWKGNNAWLN